MWGLRIATVPLMRVRLTRKLADRLDGLDLSARTLGDVFEVAPEEGTLLIAEGWAIAERQFSDRGKNARQHARQAQVAQAAERQPKSASRKRSLRG